MGIKEPLNNIRKRVVINLIKHFSADKFVKSGRLKWPEYVTRMPGQKTLFTILAARSLQNPAAPNIEHRCPVNAEMDQRTIIDSVDMKIFKGCDSKNKVYY
jgi:hypothetical protein